MIELFLVPTVVAPKPVQAYPIVASVDSASDEPMKGRCKVRVGSSTRSSSRCEYEMAGDGSFELWPDPPSNYYVAVDIDHGSARARTNGGEDLGLVKKRGACWVNPKVQICLWRR